MKVRSRDFLKQFFKLESSGGILLFIAAVLAMVVANSPLEKYYQLLLSTPVEIRVGALESPNRCYCGLMMV